MKCPDCQNELQVANLKGINIHECLKCKGKWFERNELMAVKNKADDDLSWLDFDPFGEDAKNLSIVSVGKQCPQCLKEMQSLTYLQSKVVIDKCQLCEGVWLSQGELERIIRYLEKVINTESAKDLTKETFREFVKIFIGNKGLVTEVKDFLIVVKLLKVRIAVEHPHFAQTWDNIESYLPFR